MNMFFKDNTLPKINMEPEKDGFFPIGIFFSWGPSSCSMWCTEVLTLRINAIVFSFDLHKIKGLQLGNEDNVDSLFVGNQKSRKFP